MPDDQRFALLVGNRHQVGSCLELHLLLSSHVVAENFAAGPGEFDREGEMFHYLETVIVSISCTKRGSSAKMAKAGSVLIFSKSLNPSSIALYRWEIARSLSPLTAKSLAKLKLTAGSVRCEV